MYSLHKNHYRFGETQITVCSPYFTVKEETLGLFACEEPVFPNAEITVEVNDNINAPQNAAAVKDDTEIFYGDGKMITVVRSGKDHRILWKTVSDKADTFAEIAPDRLENLNTYEMLRICDLPRVFLYNHSVILHSSFIEHNGEAILLTGDKQIGKSTQAELWRKYAGAEVINGDRSLLESRDGIWYASGLPFCGTSGICKNKSYPIKAVVMLAKGRINIGRRANGRETAACLMSQCTYERTSAEQTHMFFDIAQDITQKVPFYFFSCLPDETAVTELKKIITEQ